MQILKQSRRSKLGMKIGIIIVGMLIVVFAVMLSVSVFSTKSLLEKTLSSEMEAISRTNAAKVQELVNLTERTASSMSNYLTDAYRRSAEQAAARAAAQAAAPAQAEGGEAAAAPQAEGEEAAAPPQAEGEEAAAATAGEETAAATAPAAPPAEPVYISTVFDKEITALSYEVEQFMVGTAQNVVDSEDSILSVGAYFESYAYDDNIESYAFTATSAGGVQPAGNYVDYSAKDFYKLAKDKKQPVFTAPELYQDHWVSSAAYPIVYEGEVKGVIVVDMLLESFSAITDSFTDYKTLSSTILNQDGIIMYDTESVSNIGKDSSAFYTDAQEHAQVMQSFAEGQPFHVVAKRENGENFTKFYTPVTTADANWWALTAVSNSEMNADVVRGALTLVAIVAVGLVVVIAVVSEVLRRTLHPIGEVVAAAESIAAGNLDIHLDYNSDDEVGHLSRSFGATVDTLRRVIEDENYLLRQMAAGNFDIRTRAEECYIGEFAPVLGAVREINSKLSDTLRQIGVSADQVASGAEQVSGGSQALSQGATQQAASVEELAATITEISNQVRLNAENASQASQKATALGEEILHSNQQMGEMVQAMNEIDTTSGQISKIIKTIEDIAFQTNILALNAAVEAARAGVAGKGFAVVADEVRNLASKSAEASKNTAALIENSVRAVQNGMQIAGRTSQSLESVANEARNVVELIDQISTASGQQAGAVGQVTTGVDQISSVVQTNSATAQQSAAASQELSSQAQMLNQLVSSFKLKEEGHISHRAVQPDPLDQGGMQEQADLDSFQTYSKY